MVHTFTCSSLGCSGSDDLCRMIIELSLIDFGVALLLELVERLRAITGCCILGTNTRPRCAARRCVLDIACLWTCIKLCIVCDVVDVIVLMILESKWNLIKYKDLRRFRVFAIDYKFRCALYTFCFSSCIFLKVLFSFLYYAQVNRQISLPAQLKLYCRCCGLVRHSHFLF